HVRPSVRGPKTIYFERFGQPASNRCGRNRFCPENLIPATELSSRPERTRISYFALLATTTSAALRRESRMQIIKATGLDRKSGGAQWRDLRFSGPFLGMFFDRAKWRDLWFPFRVF